MYTKGGSVTKLEDMSSAKIFKNVTDNGSNMVKGLRCLACIDHTIERNVRLFMT